MRLMCVAALVIVSAGLVGCGAALPLQGARPAVMPSQKYGLAKSETIEKTNHMTQKINSEQSVFYFQNQGGGGAGLGILLGPLGAAANIKMIENTTIADVGKIKERINLNPEVALQQAANSTNFIVQSSVNNNDIKVTPFVLISKTDETTVHVSAAVFFEGAEGQNKWTRRYQYQLPGKYTVDELSALSEDKMKEMQMASVTAYTMLLKHIAEERDESIALERKITFNSPYMSPRFDIEMVGSLVAEREGRVWVRTVMGVNAIAPEYVKYQFIKN